MREILFRGKRLDNGEWAHGYYELMVHLPGTIEEEIYPVIHPSDDHRAVSQRVDPSTVGQYTGLKDKNGVRIFEGDIIKPADGKGRPVFFTCEFVDGAFCEVYRRTSTEVDFPFEVYSPFKDIRINPREVVGNIYDNPELLEKGGD